MKTSGIGGQAVIEGIMMRNKDKYAIAVRKPDRQIEVTVKEHESFTDKHAWANYPVIRGIVQFVESLVTGISAINYAASFYDEPAEDEMTKVDEVTKSIFKDKTESILMAVTILVSFAFAICLFMLLPYYASRLLTKYIGSQFVMNLIEGCIRLIVFVLYILLISCMRDIKRTYMYHGAEHKCINCIERGVVLTPENVKNSSRFHKRCGTSFLFLVIFISIIFFIFIRVDNTLLQIVIRVLCIPVIAGVSYEVIRYAGKSEGKLVDVISAPGVWLQHFTTKEPDMDMIEVAIQAVEAVFDWKQFLVEYYKDSENPLEEMEENAAKLAFTTTLLQSEETTRTIETAHLKDVIAKSKNETQESTSEQYIHNTLESVYEASDESESTLYDIEDVDEEDVNDDALPEGFEIIEDDDSYDNTFIHKDNVNYAESEKTSEIKTSEDEPVKETETVLEQELEEADDGIEFMEDIEEDEITGDDIPLFRERKDK